MEEKYGCDFCESDDNDDFTEVMKDGKGFSACTPCLTNNNSIKPLCEKHWVYTIGQNECLYCRIPTGK